MSANYFQTKFMHDLREATASSVDCFDGLKRDIAASYCAEVDREAVYAVREYVSKHARARKLHATIQT